MALYRFTKQIVIGTTFLVVLFGVSAWVWYATRPQPNCFDAVKNQNEEAVDCGGVCRAACAKEPLHKKIATSSLKLFVVGERLYDVMGEVENKNTDFGAVSFGYEFTLLDASSVRMISGRGTSYLMPGEKKVVARQRLATEQEAVSVKLVAFDEQWVELNRFELINLTIRDRRFDNPAESGLPTARAFGVVVNRSGLDFDAVDVVVVLKDDAGEPFAVATTDMRTLRDGEQRAFEVRWPYIFTASVARVEMDVYTNLLQNENFLVRYGRGRERFRDELPKTTADASFER